MNLAAKIYFRIKREWRDFKSYFCAVILKKKISESDVLQSWTKQPGEALTFVDCARNWHQDFPVLVSHDVDQEPRPHELEEAKSICEKKVVRVLNEDVKLDIDSLWLTDSKTGKTWPADVHYRRFAVSHHSSDGATDIRRLWEFARFSWGVSLAKSFRKTQKKEFYEAWQEKVESFIDQNPVEFGPHWLNAMEPAMRSIQWLRAYSIFIQSGAFKNSPEFNKKFLLSLIQHGHYIASHLEWTHRGRTNHYIADLVGLLALSVTLKDYQPALAWKELSVQELSREIERQTDPDGFHAEASTAYHHFVTELYTLVSLLDHQHQLGFSTRFYGRVKSMIQLDQVIRGGDNIDPRIGDDDSGYLFHPCADADFLSILFPYQNALKPPALDSSFALKHSGIYILRNKNTSIFVSCGPNGQEGVGGHAHNDKLSIVLHHLGRPIFVDAGTFTYSANIPLRNLFRSTRYHNVVQINELEQNDLSDWRCLRDRTRAKVTRWEDSAEKTVFQGEHTGFSSEGFIHRREITLSKSIDRFQIIDEVQCEGSKEYTSTLRLHVPSDISADKVLIKKNNVNLPLAELSFPEQVSIELETSQCSAVYGQRLENLCLSIKLKTHGNLRLPWEIKLKS